MEKKEQNPVSPRNTNRAEESAQKRRRVHWIWPVGLAVAGMGSAAAVLLRGCWHSNMSWPTKAEDEHGEFSYQVCMDCGVKRLFDETYFRGYGPYGYDLHELIARERLQRLKRMQRAGELAAKQDEKESA